METDHKVSEGKDKDKNGNFDLSSFLNNPDLAGLLKHLLTGAGAMAGNYLLWIKPLQEKIEAMNEKIVEQEKRIKELEAKKSPTGIKEEEPKQTGKSNSDSDYFQLDISKGGEQIRKYRHVKF